MMSIWMMVVVLMMVVIALVMVVLVRVLGGDNYHHGNGSMGPRLGNVNYLSQALLWPTRSMTGPFVANVFHAKPCLANAFYDRLSSGQRFLSQAFFWPKFLGFAVRWIVAARVL